LKVYKKALKQLSDCNTGTEWVLKLQLNVEKVRISSTSSTAHGTAQARYLGQVIINC